MTQEEMQRVKRRFYRFVNISNGCWEWTGACKSPSKNRNAGTTLPHGQFSLHGKTQLAHRVAFLLSRGRKPRMPILHSCDNPKCVRPDHIREGSLSTNLKQAVKRGRIRVPKRGLTAE